MHVIGDVDGRNVLIVDDIIDTAGTLTKTVDALKRQGRPAGARGGRPRRALRARRSQRIADSPLEQRPDHQHHAGRGEARRAAASCSPLSVAPLLGEAIRRIHENSSVSSLFV